MKLLTTLILSLGLLTLAIAQDKKEEKKADKDVIQGEWTLESGERDGQQLPEDFCKGFRLKFDGDKYEAKLADGQGEDGKFKVLEDKKPKSIEFDNSSGTRKAIYEINDGKVKLSVSDVGGELPKDLKSGHMNLVLIRVKK